MLMNFSDEFLKALRDAEKARMAYFWKYEAQIPEWLLKGHKFVENTRNQTSGAYRASCLSQGKGNDEISKSGIEGGEGVDRGTQ